MQAAAPHMAAKAQTAAPPGGSDAFGSFGFAPANDSTASAAPAPGGQDSAADAFTQALAAMMGMTAPAAFAPQTSEAAGPNGAVGANPPTPAAGALSPGAMAAAEAALKTASAGQDGAPATQTSAQAAANAAAGKAQGAPAAGRQSQAGILAAFRANAGAAANDETVPQAPQAATPAPPLNAQSATVAILTAPAQAAAPKPTTPVQKADLKESGTDDVSPPVAATPQKPQAPIPLADTGSGGGGGEADLGHRPAETGSAAETSAQAPGSADNSSFASTLAQTAAPAPTLSSTNPASGLAGAAIVSQIADQTVKSLSGKSTRFDIALEPAGLGQVNVKIQIDPTGQVSAAFAFDNPHAAAAAKSQSGQLQQALEQAGFNVAQGGLSFDVGGQGAGNARPDAGQTFASSGGQASSEPAAVAAADSTPTATRWIRASGVDITV